MVIAAVLIAAPIIALKLPLLLRWNAEAATI
jgi:hypothetical protein